MKIIYTLWLSCIMAQLCMSQVITITDFETGKPIELATLYSENPSANATTNAEGKADIVAFKGSDRIVIYAFGYTTLIRTYDELNSFPYSVGLEPSQFTMEEVVVSATKWNQTTRDVPVKISSISARDIALQNPQTAADLLGASGEVFIQKSQQGGGSPMIRGFSTNRLLYVIDGVRMNTAIFRSGNLQNVISLDPFAMEKAEVLFGPGSVIYGSDAIGGVMNFQTITPRFSHTDEVAISGDALARYASANDEKTAHFDLGLGWKKWALVTSLSSYDFSDLRMGGHGPDEYLRPFYVRRIDSTDIVVTNEDPRVQRPSGYTQINMMQKVSFRPVEKWDLHYGFHFSETSDYSRYDRHIRYRNGQPRYGEWNYGPQKWMMNNLSAAHHADNAFYDGMALRIAQQSFEESRIDRNINEAERHIRIENVEAYSLNLDFIKSSGANNALYYGLEWVKNDVKSAGEDEDISTGITVRGPARYPQADWSSYAAYVSYQRNFSEDFHVLAGLRYNTFSLDAAFDTTFYPFPYTTANLKNGSLTGSLGFTIRPDEKWILGLNVSTGFRAPNVDDAGKVFDSSPGTVIVPNPDLKPEYAYNAEAGITRVIDEKIRIDVTAYYTILSEAMVRRNFTLNGEDSIVYDGQLSQVQAIQNAAVTKVYGIQVGLEWKIAKGLGLHSDFNYQKGEEELDDGSTSPSRHAPPWFGLTRLTYTVDKLHMQAYAVYSGKKEFDDLPFEEQDKPEIYAVDENGDPWSPGWLTFNYKASYQFADRLTVGIGLENLTDRRYRPYSSGIVAAGRNFIVSLKASF